jgi:hypothetical protein
LYLQPFLQTFSVAVPPGRGIGLPGLAGGGYAADAIAGKVSAAAAATATVRIRVFIQVLSSEGLASGY